MCRKCLLEFCVALISLRVSRDKQKWPLYTNCLQSKPVAYRSIASRETRCASRSISIYFFDFQSRDLNIMIRAIRTISLSLCRFSK